MNAGGKEADWRSTGREGWFTPLRFGLLLAALFVLTHPAVVFGAQTFFYRDFGVLGYPFIHCHRECFWRGELPLWNPLSNCGAPFLAQWGTMTLYPPSLFYLLLPPPWSLNVFCLAHLWLGGLGMFQLARRWMGDGQGPALAGLAFAFGGVAQSSLMWPNYTVALGWMPWVVLLTERAVGACPVQNPSPALRTPPPPAGKSDEWGGARELKRQPWRAIVIAALAGALQMLSGVPEIILLTWGVLALLLLGNAFTEVRTSRFGRFAAVIALVAGLCAAQLLPFFELLEHSQRRGGGEASKWAMPLWGWANLFLPAFHYFQTHQGTFMQEGQSFFTSYHPGAPVLALAGMAVACVRRRIVRLLAAVALLGLVLAWGDAFPPNRWVRELIPLAGFARYPVKFVVLAAFALPLLAGFAVQWLARGAVSQSAAGARDSGTLSPPPQPSAVGKDGTGALAAGFGVTALMVGVALFVAWKFPWPYDQWTLTWQCAAGRIVFLAIAGGALWRMSRGGAAAHRLPICGVLLVAVWLDLRTHLPKLNPTLSASALIPGLGAEKAKFHPLPAPGRGRVFITPAAEAQLLRSGVRDLELDFVGKRLALWSNLNVLDAVPKVNGSSTLRVREQDEVQEWLYASQTSSHPRLLDFLGVTHASSPESAVEWAPRKGASPWVTAGQRAVFADAEETRRAMMAADFAPDKVVLLPESAQGAVIAAEEVDAQADVRRFESHFVEVEVETPKPTLLVIAQSWYPAWRAFVDGRPARLWRANHAFQAVEVPAGSHRVELRYRDNAFRLGAGIGLATLAVCLGIIARPVVGRAPDR